MPLLLWYAKSIFNLLLDVSHRLYRVDKKLDLLLDEIEAEVTDLEIDSNLDGVITKDITFMQMTDSQQAIETVVFKTKQGKPASVEPGSILWTGPPFVALTPSEDGSTCTFVAIGVGTGKASVSGDADLGAGVVTISKEFDCIVTPSQAATADVIDGTPTEQVAPGPTPNPTP